MLKIWAIVPSLLNSALQNNDKNNYVHVNVLSNTMIGRDKQLISGCELRVGVPLWYQEECKRNVLPKEKGSSGPLKTTWHMLYESLDDNLKMSCYEKWV